MKRTKVFSAVQWLTVVEGVWVGDAVGDAEGLLVAVGDADGLLIVVGDAEGALVGGQV